jgi:predicted lipid-binding transport protein (Tim44 family)
MNKILLSLFITILTFGFMISDADARRFGGGKSFGHSRSFSNQSTSNASRVQPAAAKPASSASKWLGPLAGLAVGGLLASMFMGHGLGSGILSWIMIAGLAFVAWRLISRFRTAQKPMTNAAFQTEQGRVITDAPYTSSALHDTSSPAAAHQFNSTGFDTVAFLRQAKTVFIRLQAAYDTKNLADIREFTAPQVFAEVQMQVQERGNEVNQTDVVTIEAELLDLDLESDATNASVKFTGLVRETPGANPENIKEIWHFTKDKFSQNWLVTGIQQE